MDENLTRGYCQLKTETPRIEILSSPLPSSLARGRYHSRSRILPPLDNCRCIYIALILCGIGFLLPYNSFITAVDYYQSKYGANSTIIFDMSLTYICVAFIGVVLNNILVEHISLRIRITVGYILSFATLLLVTIFDVSMDAFGPSASYRFTLVCVATVALGCTVQQSSFYGYTSMLPSRYTQAVMTGESAAGLIVSVNRILTKFLLDDVHLNTVVFFSVCISSVAVCCLVFHVTLSSNFVQFYVDLCKPKPDDQRAIISSSAAPASPFAIDGCGNSGNGGITEEVEIMDGSVIRESYGVLVIQSPIASPTSSVAEQTRYHRDLDHFSSYQSASYRVGPKSQGRWYGRSYRSRLISWDDAKSGFLSRLEVSRSVWPYMTAIGVAYFVTLCLFPGIESEIVSCRLGTWMPVILIFMFNVFDFIGKIVASIEYDWPKGRLLLLATSRVVLLPMMMLCAVPRQSPVLSSEIWPILLSALLGVTNGYFGSVPMMLAPSRVPDSQKELTGNIMTLSYSLGLTTGSAFAYLLNSSLGPNLSQDPCHRANLTETSARWNETSLLHPLYDLPASDIFPG